MRADVGIGEGFGHRAKDNGSPAKHGTQQRDIGGERGRPAGRPAVGPVRGGVGVAAMVMYRGGVRGGGDPGSRGASTAGSPVTQPGNNLDLASPPLS